MKDLMNNYMEFSDRLFGGAAESAGDSNVLVSPYSMYFLLSMLRDASAGHTKQEIEEVLCPEGSGDAGGSPEERIGGMLGLLRGVKTGALRSADAFVGKKEYTPYIRADFLKHIRSAYTADVFFGDDVAGRVNRWASSKTGGMIREIMPPGAGADFALLDAASFSAKWKKKYEADDVEDGTFTNASGEEQDAVMLCSTEDTWLSRDHFVGFVRPYRGGKYDFMAVIPEWDEHSSAALTNVRLLREMYLSGTPVKTLVTMPEFTFDFGLDMTAMLQDMGIRDAFTPRRADLGNMTDLFDVYLGSVRQKARIENSRQGTRAAAVSEADLMVTGVPLPLFEDIHHVDLNRPFVFAIMRRENAVPVFIGKVNRL